MSCRTVATVEIALSRDGTVRGHRERAIKISTPRLTILAYFRNTMVGDMRETTCSCNYELAARTYTVRTTIGDFTAPNRPYCWLLSTCGDGIAGLGPSVVRWLGWPRMQCKGSSFKLPGRWSRTGMMRVQY
jgi:hypothetical protein